MSAQRIDSVPTTWPWPRTLIALIAAILLASALAVSPTPATATDYPGQAEIAAAKAAVADAASSVADIDAAIVLLAKAAHEADVAARLADEDFGQAQVLSIEAQRQLFAANRRADEADAALHAARGDLAAVAMASYRVGGTFGQLEALVSADGFDDVIARSEALSRASVEAETTMQMVNAAELFASTMRTYAELAAVDAAQAEEAARVALDVAQQARADADQALADELETREAALVRLAQLQQTSVALERERQAGLAAERLERERAEFERVQREADGQREEDTPAGGGDISSPPSGGDVAPPATGTWKSTAAQGQRAADHALTLMDRPYLLGGSGPNYDCSGLTQESWAAAGISIPRTSRTQYEASTLVSFSALRPGDLIFWGTDRDPSKIYHVAIYVGDGMIAEAVKPGTLSRTRPYDNWGVENLMPHAGRP